MICIAVRSHLRANNENYRKRQHNNAGVGEGKGHVARTGRPQPTQSSNIVPSLFIPPFDVPTKDGVPASLGGVPCLEPGSVLCDAVAVIVALARVGVCTRCRHWSTGEKEEKHRA